MKAGWKEAFSLSVFTSLSSRPIRERKAMHCTTLEQVVKDSRDERKKASKEKRRKQRISQETKNTRCDRKRIAKEEGEKGG